MLNEAIEHLEERKSKNKSFTYEVIIVDDGSKDETTSVCSFCVTDVGETRAECPCFIGYFPISKVLEQIFKAKEVNWSLA